MKKLFGETKGRMEKTLESLKHELHGMRTGRASLALLDDIQVEAYGTTVPLNQVGTLSVPEPRMITIQPWDKSQIGAIEKAIQSSDLGFNPSNDGNLIRVPIPPLTEERRRDLVKVTKKHGEEARVAIRNIRRDAMDKLKKMKDSGEVSEDDHQRGGKEIQKITDQIIAQVDSLIEKKEAEIMEV